MEAAIQVENLGKRFGTLSALEGVTFSVSRGEIFGYVGPNGAGKTTTIRILLGLLNPTTGLVRVLGFDPASKDFGFRRRLAALLEYPGIYEELTVQENLEFYAAIYRVTDPRSKIEQVLNLTGLNARRNDQANRLSKGMKQKLAIGRILMHNAEVFFFDEPTAGLDPLFQRDIRDLIRDLAHSEKTVFLSSHNLHEVQEICSKIGILREGRLLACDTVDHLLARFQSAKQRLTFHDVQDKIKAFELLQQWGTVRNSTDGKSLEIVVQEPHRISHLEPLLCTHGVAPKEIQEAELNLDDVFHTLMSR